MKKLSLIIAMILCVTIGGVYATWTYTQNIDVADEGVNKVMNLGNVEYSGSYGTYKVDGSGLTLTIDPKAGTTHTTALYGTGQITITFTPNSVAPAEVKEKAVKSTYALSFANTDWKYEGQDIIKVADGHTGSHDIVWTPVGDGTFTFVITAEELLEHLSLTEFELDTKVKYDAYNAVLGTGAIVITVSDGITSSQPTT